MEDSGSPYFYRDKQETSRRAVGHANYCQRGTYAKSPNFCPRWPWDMEAIDYAALTVIGGVKSAVFQKLSFHTSFDTSPVPINRSWRSVVKDPLRGSPRIMVTWNAAATPLQKTR